MRIATVKKVMTCQLMWLCILFASAQRNAKAQTNTFPASGNVGIGTTSPSFKLDIAGGPIRLYGNTDSLWNIASIYTQDTGASARQFAFGARAGGFSISDETAGAFRLYINSVGNTGIGTGTPGAKLEVNGSLKLTSGSGGTIVFPDGTSQTTAWTGALCGGDYAESVDVSDDSTRYQPGDVLVIDDNHPGDFLKSTQPYSNAVAGIYSTKPGMVGRRQKNPKSAEEIPMAMIGIVPVKVTTENGPIRMHDLLVSSATPGYAMKGTDKEQMLGAVIGKALGSLESGKGTIEVLVTLQ